jgi:precorrin-6B methylase 2
MEQNPAAQMMRMMTGGVVAQTISVAAEIGIADQLARGGKSSSQLAALLNADERKLHRLLRFLSSEGIFQLDTDGVWQLTPLARLLLNDAPYSVRAGARLLGRMSATYPHMTETVRTGKCAYDLAFGKPIFEDLLDKPEDATIFDAAMNSFHGGETEAVLDAYSYEGIEVLADIGCGAGSVAMATLKRYPGMSGILFDQPGVLERTAANVRAAGLEGRCKLHAGSFFEAIPAGADAYSMRHILHDWTDDLCVRILTNIRRAIPAAGRLLIIEAVVPEGNDSSMSKLFDMFMMIFPDGTERTEAEYSKLLSAAGFTAQSVTPTLSPVSVIDARPT